MFVFPARNGLLTRHEWTRGRQKGSVFRSIPCYLVGNGPRAFFPGKKLYLCWYPTVRIALFSGNWLRMPTVGWVLHQKWEQIGFNNFNLYKATQARQTAGHVAWNISSHDLKVISLFPQINETPFTNKARNRYLGQVAPFVAHFTRINCMWGTHNPTSLQFVKSLEMWFIKLMYATQRSEQAHTHMWELPEGWPAAEIH